MKIFRLSLFLAVLHASAFDAGAEIPLEGYFIARQACPVLQSIRRQTNPGDRRTEAGRAYRLHAENKSDASHYLIEVPDAEPSRRWVATSCGEHVMPADVNSQPETDNEPTADSRPLLVLAFSWQPAFCETAAGQGKPECESQSPDRFDASNFALHGLWPQPRGRQYCGAPDTQVELDRDGRWLDLEPLQLDPELRTELQKVMPGTQSGLHRHEWLKHGTCYENGEPRRYFADSLALMRAINGSALRDLFAANIGAEVTAEQIKGAFEADFGAGSGERVRISCRQDGSRRIIVELTLGLKGDIGEAPDIAELVAAAPEIDPGCPGGVVDPVGDQ